MANQPAYAAGLLNRALDPTTQPEAIQEFLRAEVELVRELVPSGARVVDIGCGMGRHLIELQGGLQLGIGIDYELTYIVEATRLTYHGPLYFLVADARRVPLPSRFDAALCLTNTWGTMSDKLAVLAEIRRLAPEPGMRLITVYAPTSVEPRRQWYSNLGHDVLEITDEYVRTSGGFVSEHFTRDRIRTLVGDCPVREVGNVGYMVEV